MKRLFCDFCGKEFDTFGFFVGWTGGYFIEYVITTVDSNEKYDCCKDCLKKLINGEKTNFEAKLK